MVDDPNSSDIDFVEACYLGSTPDGKGAEAATLADANVGQAHGNLEICLMMEGPYF